MIEELIFAGFGGQGILLGGRLIAHAAMKVGFNTTWFPSYGPEMRGGTCNCMTAYSDDEIASPVFNAFDAALIMNLPSLERFAPMVRKGGLLLVNTSLVNVTGVRRDVRLIEVPVTELARQFGTDRSANVVMVGAYIAVRSWIRPATLEQAVRETFVSKGDEVVELNLRAFRAGHEAVAAAAV